MKYRASTFVLLPLAPTVNPDEAPRRLPSSSRSVTNAPRYLLYPANRPAVGILSRFPSLSSRLPMPSSLRLLFFLRLQASTTASTGVAGTPLKCRASEGPVAGIDLAPFFPPGPVLGEPGSEWGQGHSCLTHPFLAPLPPY